MRFGGIPFITLTPSFQFCLIFKVCDMWANNPWLTGGCWLLGCCARTGWIVGWCPLLQPLLLTPHRLLPPLAQRAPCHGLAPPALLTTNQEVVHIFIGASVQYVTSVHRVSASLHRRSSQQTNQEVVFIFIGASAQLQYVVWLPIVKLMAGLI